MPVGIYAEIRSLSNLRFQTQEELTRIKNRLARWFSIYFPEYKDVYRDLKAASGRMVLKEAPLPEDIKKLGAEGVNLIWRNAKLRGAGIKRAKTLVSAAEHSIGSREAPEAARMELRDLLEDMDVYTSRLKGLLGSMEEKLREIPYTDKLKAHTPKDRDAFPPMQISGVDYDEKQEAGKALVEACKSMKSPEAVMIGSYRGGLALGLHFNPFVSEFVATLKGAMKHTVTLGSDIYGNITRIDNMIAKFEDDLGRCRDKLENTKEQLETAKAESTKPFPREQELADKTARLEELNALLDMDKTDHVMLDAEPDADGREPERTGRDMER